MQAQSQVRHEMTKIIFPRKIKFPEKYKNGVNLQKASLYSSNIVFTFKVVRKHKKECISLKSKNKIIQKHKTQLSRLFLGK